MSQENNQEPSPFGYLSFQDYLKELFVFRKGQRPRYTYEMYSEDSGFGKTPYMHLICNGGRKLTEKSAKKLVASIPLRKEKRHYFLAMVEYENAKDVQEKEQAFSHLLEIRANAMGNSHDSYDIKYFSEWYHGVIRELVTFENFQSDPKWLSEKLDFLITPQQAAYSLDLLNKIGYIEFDFHKQKWIQTKRVVSVRGEVAELAVTKFHQQMLELARHSLFDQPANKREFAALTMSVNKKQFKQLKKDIRQFAQSLASKYGNDELQQSPGIVQVNLQLFPILWSEDEIA